MLPSLHMSPSFEWTQQGNKLIKNRKFCFTLLLDFLCGCIRLLLVAGLFGVFVKDGPSIRWKVMYRYWWLYVKGCCYLVILLWSVLWNVTSAGFVRSLEFLKYAENSPTRIPGLLKKNLKFGPALIISGKILVFHTFLFWHGHTMSDYKRLSKLISVKINTVE